MGLFPGPKEPRVSSHNAHFHLCSLDPKLGTHSRKSVLVTLLRPEIWGFDLRLVEKNPGLRLEALHVLGCQPTCAWDTARDPEFCLIYGTHSQRRNTLPNVHLSQETKYGFTTHTHTHTLAFL